MLTTPIYLAAPGEIAPDLLALLRWAAWVLSLPVLLFSAGPFFSGAWRALRQRRIGMDVPVALGIAITFVAGTGATFDPGGAFGHEPYLDSMTMFVAFLLGARWLELRARTRGTEALDAAAAAAAATAWRGWTPTVRRGPCRWRACARATASGLRRARPSRATASCSKATRKSTRHC